MQPPRNTPLATPRLYDDLAALWPAISPPEHYRAEADTIRTILDRSLGQPPADRKWSVLELGAGGGHTLVHLTGDFDCTAADLSEPMLDNCRALNPGVATVVGDMRTMRLDRQFDAVLIHDAIDYMVSPEDAAAALQTAAAHLRPGGVALIAPTYTTETFTDGEVADDGTEIDGIAGGDHLTFFSFVHDPDPADTCFEMILLYLIRDAATRQVRVVEDRHTCGLFSLDTWCDLMEQAGLSTTPILMGGEDGDAENDADNDDEPAAWSTLFIGIKR